MSLVNDLMIELERKETTSSDAGATGFKEHAPRDPAGSRDQRTSNPLRTPLDLRLRKASKITLGIAFGAMLVSLGLLAINLATSNPRDEDGAKIAQTDAPSPPPVSAQLPSARGAIARVELPGNAALPSSKRFERTTKLHDLVVGRHDGTMRMRLEGDPEMTFRLDHDASNNRLSILLLETTLSAPLDQVELARTPVRSLNTDLVAEGIHVALDLDPGTRVESHALTTPDRMTLFIDFERAAVQSASNRTQIERAPAKPPEARPLETARRNEIVRSDRDVLRQSAQNQRQLARNSLLAARNAQADGEPEEALEHYSAAIRHSPGHREALIAWAELMSERGHLPEAITRVHSARQESPNDRALAMLHARLLERSGDIESAITLLDRTSFTLNDAPEIHGMIAAYLQRAGQHEAATSRYEAIVQRYPSESRWWMGLGISLEATGRASEAADVYRIAMKLGDLSRPSQQWVSSRVAAIEAEG